MTEGKQKICFVIPSLSGGGAERVVSVLASQLIRDEHDISVIKYFDTENDYPTDERIKVVCISNGFEDAYRTLSYPQKIKKIRYALKQINPEYVVPFLPHVAVHVFLAGLGLHLKTIQTVRVAPAISPASFVMRKFRDVLVAISYSTFVQTGSQKQYFSDRVHHKICVLPNPVSETMFEAKPQYTESITDIVSLGRLTAQKNFEMLIEAVNAIKEEGRCVRLSIYGEGELSASLQRKIEEMGCSDFCRLCGRTADTAETLCKSHIFVLPSNFEGMPNALMEAMAVGLPCISTDCQTGPGDLIQNGRGILVPVGDRQAMIGAIKQMMDHPDMAMQMGMAAKEYMKENYSPNIIAERFINDVVQRRCKSGGHCEKSI